MHLTVPAVATRSSWGACCAQAIKILWRIHVCIVLYAQAIDILWRIHVCMVLFALANLFKATFAKLLSTHFYKTAHFKKLETALEKEYFLQVRVAPGRHQQCVRHRQRVRHRQCVQCVRHRQCVQASAVCAGTGSVCSVCRHRQCVQCVQTPAVCAVCAGTGSVCAGQAPAVCARA